MYTLSKDNNRALYFNFMRDHPKVKATPIETRALLHQELIEDFGGDSDTDGEGYDSDTAEQLYPSSFKF